MPQIQQVVKYCTTVDNPLGFQMKISQLLLMNETSKPIFKDANASLDFVARFGMHPIVVQLFWCVRIRNWDHQPWLQRIPGVAEEVQMRVWISFMLVDHVSRRHTAPPYK